MNTTFAHRARRVAAALVAACGSPQRDPVPITPPADVAKAPVARVPVAPPTTAPPPTAPLGTTAPASRARPRDVSRRRDLCLRERRRTQRKLTAIAFDEKVGKLCRTHPEMGPCQYERNICRGSGGRVYAADGTEITMALEAEYDKKVMRVRFKAN